MSFDSCWKINIMSKTIEQVRSGADELFEGLIQIWYSISKKVKQMIQLN